MFFFVSICLVQTHRYDLSSKKARYGVAHHKFCQLDLRIPLQNLQQIHELYGQVDQKHWSVKTIKDSYTDSLNTLSAWIDDGSWSSTVVFAEKDTFTLLDSATNYLPVQKKAIHDYPGLESLAKTQSSTLCEMVRANGNWHSLRAFAFSNQKQIFVLTRIRLTNT